jgi:methionyl aminopeptidase
LVTIKSKKEIELMRDVCKLVANTYDYVGSIIKAGMSTYELDQLVEKYMREHGGIPAEKGYPSGIKGVPDFPGSICSSINDVVIHGIPSKKEIIKDGDIVSIDTVILKNGFNGDAARTFLIGECSEEKKKLVEVTKQAFYEGLKYAKPGYRVGDISHAVAEYVWANGFDVIREFQGHGIGREMHEDPGVPNYGKAGHGCKLEPGMTICIEPMVVAGRPDILELDDGWTIVTEDGKMSAHYENTILITENEPEILTI